MVAARAGIAPSAVHLVDMPAERAADELSAGRVDAVITWEPVATQALTATHGRKLFDTSQVTSISWTIYTTRGELARQRAGDIEKFMQVWQRTLDYQRRAPDEAYAIIAQINQQTPAEVRAFTLLDRVLDVRDNLVAFSYAPGFESLHGSARQVNDFMLQRGLVKERVDTAVMFDSRFLRRLEQPPIR